jgi:hypothetical protein
MADEILGQSKAFNGLDTDDPTTIDGISNLIVLFENRNTPPATCKALCGGATGRAGSDNENVEFLTHSMKTRYIESAHSIALPRRVAGDTGPSRIEQIRDTARISGLVLPTYPEK